VRSSEVLKAYSTNAASADVAPVEGVAARDAFVGEDPAVAATPRALLEAIAVGVDLPHVVVHSEDAPDGFPHDVSHDLLEPGEIVDIPESATVCAQAANAFRALCSMADVRDLYHGGTALHEVPFTLRLDGRIVRGTIDCLVVKEDAIVVLEFKTGRERPEHAFQVDLYGKAMQAVHPGRRVDLRVIYLGDAIN